MPELAAHLERVARELAEQLVRQIWPLINENDSITERDAIQPLLAAALAACAREAKLEQASELEHPLLAARNFVRGRHSTLTYGPRSLLERLDVALLQITKLRLEVTGERAVGEKA